MKKIVLGISMSLAVLAFLVSPAAAAGGSHGAPALSDFLASLAPAPVTAAKRPAIQGKALCTASASCGSGGTISCSGNNSTTSCSAADQNCSTGQQGYVTCDGVTTVCPNACPCPSDFCTTGRANCAADCDPCGFSYTCSLSTCTDNCRCRFTHCFIQ